MYRSHTPMLLLAAACSLATAAAASVQTGTPLVDFSLEQLSEIVVTSVSRQETRLADAPASIYLISGAEIRRSGATSLPEALRLAPNLQVARSDPRTYAVTARGFNSTIENKLLVLIDGRSVYSPLFSGVFWDMQDVVMEDIERIEVISGPGATIWGANAVNGVINIITRAAKNSQGTLLAASAGEPGRSGTARYGGTFDGGYYRLYAKTDRYIGADNEAGQRQNSGWHRSQAGFRADWNGAGATLSGDAYQGALAQLRGADVAISGANLVGRLTRKFDSGADLRLQAYLDHTERNQPNTGAQLLDTVDLEAQHGLRLGEAQQLVWGGGYRHTWDRVQNGSLLRFTPAERVLRWANVFAQDELTISPALRLTAGLKLEHNIYTGIEALPSVRLAWSPDSASLWWGAASRTVRAPSRIDRDLYVITAASANSATPRYSIAGGPDFVSETARVLELGYRSQPTTGLSYSATAFYSDYDKLRTLEPQAGRGAVFRNEAEGRTFGLEGWARWQAARNWRLSAGAVLQNIELGLKPGSLDTAGASGLNANDPNQYWSLRSAYDLSDSVQANLGLRYVGALTRPAVAAYYEADLRLAWQPRRDIEIALSGQNLLHAEHAEFGSAATRQVVPRTVLLQLVVRR